MSQHPRARTLLAAVVLLANLVAAGPAIAASVPGGFTDSVLASGLPSPTAMAFAPDGRLFVAQQGGALRVIKNGTLLATPFLTVTVSSSGERGLLGVAFDPNFATNHYVYVYYTATSPATHNRVSRFTANGDVAVPGSEVVILELNNLSSATNHNGGAIHFGPDGKLYIATGDNASSANSQSLSNLLGKILRVNADASIPTDNPFYGSTGGANRAIWALGLRNPFTFAFQPGSGRLFINDVGQNTYEEVNDGIAGSNYGWPASEGPTGTPGHRGPVYSYNHADGPFGGCAISGGAFYNPAAPQFPSSYLGSYFFADFCSGWINRVDPANGFAVSSFASGISFPVDLQVGPDGALYYLARGGGGIVGRIGFPEPLPPVETTFFPIGPVRVLDTRFGNGLSSRFVAGQSRIWQVAGREGIPPNAVAVTGNVTVTGQTAAGWLTVSPTPTNEASPSTINFPVRDDRANNVTIRLAGDGTLAAVFKAPAGRTTHVILDVTGYFVATGEGATYRSVTPGRSLDSRFGVGLDKAFESGVPRSWPVGGRNGIPGAAIAVTGNVTVTGQQSAGYVAVTPDPQVSPLTSTINFPAGDDRANGITVKLGSGGVLNAVFRGAPGARAHLIFDVTGYYLPDGAGARFIPLVPARILDSRFGIGLGGRFHSGTPRELTVAGAGGVPGNATAITGNLTVVNQTWPGYVALTRTPTTALETSTLNVPSGDIRANGVTGPLGGSGSAGLLYVGGSGTTDLLLDVTGYFR
jgi:glucose/arabinose dehydrogenase